MPLPKNEQVVETSKGLVSTLKGLFGTPPGFRPAHAKGTLLSGIFKPSPEAAQLSSAKHFNDVSTPVSARFSDSTGIPQIPDTDSNANPRGFAVRFHLGNDAQGKHVHTDIVSHSTPFFPARTGEETLEFFQAVAASGPDAAHPTPVEQFLGSHPAALAFVQAPKPFPLSFATEQYFGLNTIILISADGKETYVRYRWVPAQGVHSLDDAALEEKGSEYLFDDINDRVGSAAQPVAFKLLAQVAQAGDITDDVTIHWPEDREVVELGQLVLEKVDEDNASEQKRIIFDPVPRVQGLAPSKDPLLDVRAGVYLISGRERRAA
jgi:catalase